jgi:HDOD domain
MSDIAQRLFIHLLADSHGQLAGIGIKTGHANPAPLAGDDALSDLTKRLPCLLPESLATSLEESDCAALVGAGVRVVADSELATPADADGLVAASGRYCAGDWYLQPLARPLKDQTGSRALALKLLELVVADAETREIEEIFRREPTLSYHLLRLVNSPSIGSGRRIDSFAQAIMVLGRRQLRRWLNLLLFTARKDDPRTSMLLARVCLRARLLEQLAHEAGEDRDFQERAFMAGMFSLLGVTFGMPLEEVLKPLNLDAEVVAALLQRSGPLGELLAAVEACEQGDGAQVQALLGPRMPQPLELDRLQLEACAWMLSLIGDAGDGHG